MNESTELRNNTFDSEVIPLVSIDCITYNHKQYIRDAIEGFLMQITNFPVEILIHDDASTDGTAEIIREYEKQYPWLIKPVYQTENQYSKHNGIISKIQYARARGKYLAFCEGDDYWTDPYKLQKQVDFLESHPEYSMCVHNSTIHYEDGEYPDSLSTKTCQDFTITTEDLLCRWSFATATILCQRSIMKEFQESLYLNGIYNEDWFLALMLSLKGPIQHLSDIMSVYRRHHMDRYSGMELYFLNKRIEVLELFDQISDNLFHYLIIRQINVTKKRAMLQKLYIKIPFVKKFYRCLKNVFTS